MPRRKIGPDPVGASGGPMGGWWGERGRVGRGWRSRLAAGDSCARTLPSGAATHESLRPGCAQRPTGLRLGLAPSLATAGQSLLPGPQRPRPSNAVPPAPINSGPSPFFLLPHPPPSPPPWPPLSSPAPLPPPPRAPSSAHRAPLPSPARVSTAPMPPPTSTPSRPRRASSRTSPTSPWPTRLVLPLSPSLIPASCPCPSLTPRRRPTTGRRRDGRRARSRQRILSGLRPVRLHLPRHRRPQGGGGRAGRRRARQGCMRSVSPVPTPLRLPLHNLRRRRIIARHPPPRAPATLC